MLRECPGTPRVSPRIAFSLQELFGGCGSQVSECLYRSVSSLSAASLLGRPASDLSHTTDSAHHTHRIEDWHRKCQAEGASEHRKKGVDQEWLSIVPSLGSSGLHASLNASLKYCTVLQCSTIVHKDITYTKTCFANLFFCQVATTIA